MKGNVKEIFSFWRDTGCKIDQDQRFETQVCLRKKKVKNLERSHSLIMTTA